MCCHTFLFSLCSHNSALFHSVGFAQDLFPHLLIIPALPAEHPLRPQKGQMTIPALLLRFPPHPRSGPNMFPVPFCAVPFRPKAFMLPSPSCQQPVAHCCAAQVFVGCTLGVGQAGRVTLGTGHPCATSSTAQADRFHPQQYMRCTMAISAQHPTPILARWRLHVQRDRW